VWPCGLPNPNILQLLAFVSGAEKTVSKQAAYFSVYFCMSYFAFWLHLTNPSTGK
jgi:hypothetical protein